jgi:MATE family multidrug resistance protein
LDEPRLKSQARSNAPDGGDWRAVLVMSAPIIVTTSSRAMMGFVDTWMVSRLGVSEAAAVGVGGIVVFSLIGFGIGLTSAVSTFASQCLGRRDYHQCSGYAWQGLWLSLLMGAAALLFLPLIEPIMGLFGHAPDVRRLEVQYASITMLSLGPSAAAAGLGQYFNGIHRPAISMVSALVANVFNFAANYVLIFGALGFPRLGVAGAALGTLLATVFRTFMLLAFLWWGRWAQQFHARHTWRWNTRQVWDLLRIGSPVGAQFTLDVLAWAMFLAWLVGQFGTAHIAASQFVWQYLHVSFMPAIGVGIALTAVIGKAIGEGRLDLATRRMRVGLLLCCGYMGTMGLIFLLFRHPLISFFCKEPEPEVLRLGGHMMVFAAIFQVFDGMNIAYNNGLKGAGDTRWPAAANIVMVWGVMVGGGLLAVQCWPQAESFGPWVAATTFIILLSLALAYRWYSGRWREINLFERHEQDEPAPAMAGDTATAACDAPVGE